ncbi:MAG: hypothetical protein ACREPB_04950 [Arenimonas sp.]
MTWKMAAASSVQVSDGVQHHTARDGADIACTERLTGKTTVPSGAWTAIKLNQTRQSFRY